MDSSDRRIKIEIDHGVVSSYSITNVRMSDSAIRDLCDKIDSQPVGDKACIFGVSPDGRNSPAGLANGSMRLFCTKEKSTNRCSFSITNKDYSLNANEKARAKSEKTMAEAVAGTKLRAAAALKKKRLRKQQQNLLRSK